MPGKISIERASSISDLESGWSVQLDAMPHSPLQSTGSTGEVSFQAPTTAETPRTMYNAAVFTYTFPADQGEISIPATVPLPPPTPPVTPQPPSTGSPVGWGDGGWGDGSWGGDGSTSAGGTTGGSTGDGSGWGTEAWGSDPWGA